MKSFCFFLLGVFVSSYTIQEAITPNIELFSAISDEIRIKILMVLNETEFTVNELKDILDIHQSNASRHLTRLSAAKLVKDRREGTKAFYGLSDDLYMSPSILEVVLKSAEQLKDIHFIKARVKDTLSKRKKVSTKKFHKLDEVGGGLKAQVYLFSKLIMPFEHAIDIGCGEGAELSLMLAHRCKKVSAIDNNANTIIQLKKHLQEKNILNVHPIKADMNEIPLKNESADLILMSQVLHHASSPQKAIKEAVRLLKVNGLLALLDLAEHNEEELRETHGHLWLGFDQKRIEFLLKNLPCRILSSEVVLNDPITSIPSSFQKLPIICTIIQKETHSKY